MVDFRDKLNSYQLIFMRGCLFDGFFDLHQEVAELLCLRHQAGLE